MKNWYDLKYDALRWVIFYDWGYTNIKTPAAGEEEEQTLKGYGFGVRFNITEKLNCRVEFGYPIGKDPSDGDSVHKWVEFSIKF